MLQTQQSSVGFESALAILHPLNDLADNWAIDIASCLQDYLEDVVGVVGHSGEYTRNDDRQQRVQQALESALVGQHKLNFTHAALVLNNSTSIYSRKVEYLHSLVLKSLEEFARVAQVDNDGGTGTSRPKGSGKRQSDACTTMEKLVAFDPQDEFVLMNYCIPMPVRPLANFQPKTIRELKRRFKDKPSHTLDKGDSNDRSTDGTKSASRGALTDPSSTTIDTQNSTLFARNTLSSSRAMTLDQSISMSKQAVKMYRMKMRLNENDSSGARRLHSWNPRAFMADDGLWCLPIPGRKPKRSIALGNQINNSLIEQDGPCGTNVRSDDAGEDMGGTWDDGVEDDHAGFSFPDNAADPSARADNNKSPFSLSGATLTDNIPVGRNGSIGKSVSWHTTTFPAQAPSRADPWAMLDPLHTDEDMSKVHPLRVGCTLRLPPGIHELPSECVTGARTKSTMYGPPKAITTLLPKVDLERERQAARTWLATETFQAAYAAAAAAATRKRSVNDSEQNDVFDDEQSNRDLESVMACSTNASSTTASLLGFPLQGLAFGNEFAYLARATAQRQAAERREQRKQLRQQHPSRQGGRDPISSRISGGTKELDGAFGNVDGVANEIGFDNHDDDVGFAIGGGFDDGDNDGDYETIDPAHALNPVEPFSSNTGIVTLDELYGRLNHEHADDDGFDEQQDMRSFAELCRAHVVAFAREADKYLFETKLSLRVRQWQEGLEPILEQEDHRPIFDIHQVSCHLIESIQEEVDRRQNHKQLQGGKFVSFSRVSRGAEPYQVCRQFLSLLSLANTGNISLLQDSPNDDDQELNSLSIELLCADLICPMASYRVPSFQSLDSIEAAPGGSGILPPALLG